jgi:hypothetical protein
MATRLAIARSQLSHNLSLHAHHRRRVRAHSHAKLYRAPKLAGIFGLIASARRA